MKLSLNWVQDTHTLFHNIKLALWKSRDNIYSDACKLYGMVVLQGKLNDRHSKMHGLNEASTLLELCASPERP